ncbi:hypothetical protein RJ640_015408 [Escallonia rubra]|uniref:Uncharacterized protein n=1 Tax=Escallonia rubra TaxID=112253 RepID=A0AA88UHU8_9ASTE|nr:hypothetical protein RJ640_015408 [Escallonia rubra]
MDQAWVAQVVESALAEDLGSGLEPHCLTELDAVAGQNLREDTRELRALPTWSGLPQARGSWQKFLGQQKAQRNPFALFI